MQDYTVSDPEFSETLTVTETTDTNHADNINTAPMVNFENTMWLYEFLTEAWKEIQENKFYAVLEDDDGGALADDDGTVVAADWSFDIK